AASHSYPAVIEECEGMVAAAGDVGWTMELCLLVNFGDVLVEYLGEYLPVKGAGTALAPGCSQLMARGAATADGRLYHARILDWGDIDYLVEFPVIFVREPDGLNPHVTVGFPGSLSPYTGMNWHGLSIGSNESDPLDGDQHDLVGRSHVQMLGMLLAWADSLDAATSAVLGSDHMTVEQFGMADGTAGEAAAFEMTATAVGVRAPEDDVLWLTNHFVDETTAGLDMEPAGASSLLRFDRLSQLAAPDGVDTRYGEIDPEVLVEILRDRVNPYTFEESSIDDFDNDSSLATNGALYQIVFSPEELVFWVAAGAIPVPQQPFVGFSVGELLGMDGAVAAEPAIIE
ncbi:MAG: C45 family autoproteolytic acyltransferase/hydrolase, partial [Proteobacteria bacterium]|nr:C45 family autoproteolytic acyltransferase/hydrolase [Pseudomonadota bacterium]